MEDQNQSDRQMFTGNWTCSGCGADITELPFEPSGDRPLYCRDCHRKNRDERQSRPQRQMFQGDWECAGCGMKITQLPFEPNGESPIYCRDCYLKSKNA